ncbi:MAG: hypothetical protein RML73_00960 [Anaerolineae bacterium]|nr:hypothetical protein [Anaerolineae bacterium]
MRVNITAGIANAMGYGATYVADFTAKVGYSFNRPTFVVEQTGEESYKITLPPLELLACKMSEVFVANRSTSLTVAWQLTKTNFVLIERHEMTCKVCLSRLDDFQDAADFDLEACVKRSCEDSVSQQAISEDDFAKIQILCDENALAGCCQGQNLHVACP